MTCMFDDVVILQGEDRNWSQLGPKGLKARLRGNLSFCNVQHNSVAKKSCGSNFASNTTSSQPLSQRKLALQVTGKVKESLTFHNFARLVAPCKMYSAPCLVMFNVTIALQVAGKIALCNSRA